jgi:hypothetical protein
MRGCYVVSVNLLVDLTVYICALSRDTSSLIEFFILTANVKGAYVFKIFIRNVSRF